MLGSVSKESLRRRALVALESPMQERLQDTMWWSDQGHMYMSAEVEFATRIGEQKM